MMRRWQIFIGCCLTLMGCSRSHYHSEPLQSLTEKPKPQEKVIALYKPLSKKESMAYLNRPWQAKGYQPVQIAIENSSDIPMKFSKESLSLPIASEDTIKYLAHRHTKLKATTIGAPSATALTLGMIGLLAAPASFGLSLLVPIGIGSAGLHTVSTMLKADVDLDKDYDGKFLHDGIIGPHEVLEGVVFVPKREYHDKFTLQVVDTKNNKTLSIEARKHRYP